MVFSIYLYYNETKQLLATILFYKTLLQEAINIFFARRKCFFYPEWPPDLLRAVQKMFDIVGGTFQSKYKMLYGSITEH